MTDDRTFDVLRTLDRRLEPRPAFADELFATLAIEAGLRPGAGGIGLAGRIRGRWGRAQRMSALRVALIGLVLLALLATAIVVVGGWFRTRPAFPAVHVEAAEVGAGVGWTTGTLASEGDASGQPVVVRGDGSESVAFVDLSNDRIRAARCLEPGCASLGTSIDGGPVTPNVIGARDYAAAAADGGVWIARATGALGTDSQIELARICPEPVNGCAPSTPSVIGRGDAAVIVLRPDGRPAVLFGSVRSTTATVYACADPACSSSATTQIPAAPTGLAAAALPDGRLVAATNRDGSVRVLACTDDACTDTTSATLGPGQQVRIAVGPDGNPVVAALNDRSAVLYRCSDASCGSGSSAVLAELGPVASGADELDTIDLAVGPGGRPFVSIGAGGRLRLVACGSVDCSTMTRIDLAPTSPALAAPHAIAVDPAGRPFVVFGARSDLQVARCVTDSCVSAPDGAGSPSVTASGPPSGGPVGSGTGGSGASGLTSTTVEQVDRAYSPAVTIGADGLPVAVYAVGSTALHVLRCGDDGCTSGNAIANVPASDPAGSAIAIGGDGNPVIAFATWEGTLTVIRCRDAGCGTSDRATPLDDADPELVGLAVPADDRPILAYVAATDRGIRLARCQTPVCEAVTTVTVDPNEGGWLPNTVELRLRANGDPVIATAFANGDVRLARCESADCGTPTVLTVGTKALDKTTASLGIGPDDLPVLPFYSDASLLVGRCVDAACATMPTVRVDAATAGWWSPIGVGFGSDGLPRIVYFSPTNLDTKLAVCHDPACATADLIPIEASDANGADDATGLAFRPDGAPVLVYVRDTAVVAEACADERCGP